MTRFSTHADRRLRQAGWFPGRQVPQLVATWKASLKLSDGFELFRGAEEALLEFGGLSFNERGPGVTAAREPFTLDPMLAAHESDRFTDFANQLSTSFFPLGEAAGGHYFLAIATTNRVYLLMDDLLLLGENMDDALERLLTGLAAEEIT